MHPSYDAGDLTCLDHMHLKIRNTINGGQSFSLLQQKSLADQIGL